MLSSFDKSKNGMVSRSSSSLTTVVKKKKVWKNEYWISNLQTKCFFLHLNNVFMHD